MYSWSNKVRVEKLNEESCRSRKKDLSIEDFGIYTTSLVLYHIHCKGKQSLFTANNLGQLRLTYQGLATHIISKYGGSKHLPRLHFQACPRKAIARTMF